MEKAMIYAIKGDDCCSMLIWPLGDTPGLPGPEAGY